MATNGVLSIFPQDFHSKNLLPQKMMQAQTQTHPSTFNEIAETPYEIKIMEVKRGDETLYQPRIVAKDSDYQIYFRTAPLPALYGTHGVDGDKTGDKAKFNKPLDQACVTYTMKKGCAFPKVKKAMPNLLKDQETTFDILKKQHRELLVAAFESDNVKCPGKDKARKQAASALKKAGTKKPTKEQIDADALKIYLENAHDSGIKEITWLENGEEVEGEVLKVKRKVRGVRYVNEEEDGKTVRKRTLVNTFPIFHRGTPTGEYYEKEFGDYMPRDTLLVLRLRRSFYSTPMMYGSNLTFDKDVIVLCGPKRKKKQSTSKPIVFFEDDDVQHAAESDIDIESSGKRKRDENDVCEDEPSSKH